MRSMSQGRANYTMEFAKYMEVPTNVAEVDHEESFVRIQTLAINLRGTCRVEGEI